MKLGTRFVGFDVAQLYAESLFRAAKYRPEFPAKGFADLEQARTWANGFVHWYNFDHRHSGELAVGFCPVELRYFNAAGADSMSKM